MRAAGGGAKDVAVGVEDNAALRLAGVRRVLETVNWGTYPIVPDMRELIDCPKLGRLE